MALIAEIKGKQYAIKCQLNHNKYHKKIRKKEQRMPNMFLILTCSRKNEK
jgi:hypothetical protein